MHEKQRALKQQAIPILNQCLGFPYTNLTFRHNQTIPESYSLVSHNEKLSVYRPKRGFRRLVKIEGLGIFGLKPRPIRKKPPRTRKPITSQSFDLLFTVLRTHLEESDGYFCWEHFIDEHTRFIYETFGDIRYFKEVIEGLGEEGNPMETGTEVLLKRLFHLPQDFDMEAYPHSIGWRKFEWNEADLLPLLQEDTRQVWIEKDRQYRNRCLEEEKK